ncbi:hypothetical protein BJX76DRAFT_241834 [Aspergillus varians]
MSFKTVVWIEVPYSKTHLHSKHLLLISMDNVGRFKGLLPLRKRGLEGTIMSLYHCRSIWLISGKPLGQDRGPFPTALLTSPLPWLTGVLEPPASAPMSRCGCPSKSPVTTDTLRRIRSTVRFYGFVFRVSCPAFQISMPNGPGFRALILAGIRPFSRRCSILCPTDFGDIENPWFLFFGFSCGPLAWTCHSQRLVTPSLPFRGSLLIGMYYPPCFYDVDLARLGMFTIDCSMRGN